MSGSVTRVPRRRVKTRRDARFLRATVIADARRRGPSARRERRGAGVTDAHGHRSGESGRTRRRGLGARGRSLRVRRPGRPRRPGPAVIPAEAAHAGHPVCLRRAPSSSRPGRPAARPAHLGGWKIGSAATIVARAPSSRPQGDHVGGEGGAGASSTAHWLRRGVAPHEVVSGRSERSEQYGPVQPPGPGVGIVGASPRRGDGPVSAKAPEARSRRKWSGPSDPGWTQPARATSGARYASARTARAGPTRRDRTWSDAVDLITRTTNPGKEGATWTAASRPRGRTARGRSRRSTRDYATRRPHARRFLASRRELSGLAPCGRSTCAGEARAGRCDRGPCRSGRVGTRSGRGNRRRKAIGNGVDAPAPAARAEARVGLPEFALGIHEKRT